MPKKILLATGGTGGHIFPALSIEKALKKEKFSVLTTADTRFANFHNFDKEHVFIPAASLSASSVRTLIKNVFTLIKGFLRSLSIINKFNPDIIIGFGGYPTFPVILAGLLLRKKFILHEANMVVGKVNKIFIPYAECLTTGFSKITGVDDKYKNKIFFTGNPIRDNFTPPKKEKSVKKISLMVIGGSQGAKIFSKMIPDMIINLPKDIKEKIYVCQQVREEDIPSIKEKYAKENINCEIQSFFNDMPKKLSKSNIVIARAGASTISELIRMRLPTIFIPYPTAADDHQLLNAKEIVNSNAGWLVHESNDSHLQLLQIFKSIVKDSSILTLYSTNLEKLDQDGCMNLVELVKRKL